MKYELYRRAYKNLLLYYNSSHFNPFQIFLT
jgi:hypothetical protein